MLLKRLNISPPVSADPITALRITGPVYATRVESAAQVTRIHRPSEGVRQAAGYTLHRERRRLAGSASRGHHIHLPLSRGQVRIAHAQAGGIVEGHPCGRLLVARAGPVDAEPYLGRVHKTRPADRSAEGRTFGGRPV